MMKLHDGPRHIGRGREQAIYIPKNGKHVPSALPQRDDSDKPHRRRGEQAPWTLPKGGKQ
jgi:hypothetical protein